MLIDNMYCGDVITIEHVCSRCKFCDMCTAVNGTKQNCKYYIPMRDTAAITEAVAEIRF